MKTPTVFLISCLVLVVANKDILESSGATIVECDDNEMEDPTCPSDDSNTVVICDKEAWDELEKDSQYEYKRIGWTKSKWDKRLEITDEKDVELVYWEEVCEEYRTLLTKQEWDDESWDEAVHARAGGCKGVFWKELTEASQDYYEEEGWTEEMWDDDRWIHGRKDAEPILWRDICEPYRRELEVRGWNEEAWDSDDGTKMSFYNEAELTWDELTEERQNQWIHNGYHQEDFEQLLRGKTSGGHNDILAPAGDFRPLLLPLAVPELQALNFTYLERLDRNVCLVASLTHGQSEDVVESVPLGEYIARIRTGEKDTYAQMEDVDNYKEGLWKPVGRKVFKYLRAALAESELAKNDQYKQEWADLDDGEFDWAMFLGGKGTTTAMHYDTDAFSFLYVVEGRKKVILLENTGLLNETRFNISSFFHGSAWTDLNIIKSENQPEGTVVIEVGPGEGISIPHRAWHAVENVEHTVAYAIRLM